ncbi:acetyl/propionyl/methylcrotonyl-CoA carboxylase subunit alpha [Jatrophihabitans sp. YIM 134969]
MITRLLVANRGEIAARVMRTARAMDIATVAVYSDPDAGLPFVRAADEAVRLPGSTPAETYLDVDAVLGAAAATGADAVHPGYGFLSENADFARRCAAAGLTFVGPTPEAVEAMGSKTAAKELMAAAGVPVLPGAVFGAGDEPGDDEVVAAAERVGFPLLVKAAFGGGGRGMRIVRSVSEVVDAVAGARREAASAFGDGTVFLERFVDAPRHVEVQIVGDTHGTVVHLFERECSIQRRYQKIIEEAPSPAVDDILRDALCRAAVAAGEAIGYVGAGTVEFVLDRHGDFFFLEVNTRLQVEHPVTEAVTGLDLVRVQLEVADGRPLADDVVHARLQGHAVEARLYAEDVPGGYLPTSGDVVTFDIPARPGLRVDAGFASGTRVSTFYDSMLAKVIAHGPTRDDARRILAAALDRARLHGVTTNRDLLVGVLRESAFAAGDMDTGYLDRHEDLRRPVVDPATTARHAVAAAVAAQASHRAAAPVLATLPSGWRNNRSSPQVVGYRVAGDPVEVRYGLHGDALTAEVDGVGLGEITVVTARPDLVELVVGGVRRAFTVLTSGSAVFVDSPLGHTAFEVVDRFPDPSAVAHPGSLLAPMPGTVVRIEASIGDTVRAGATILAVEAMKMEHTVNAPSDGVVTGLAVAVGAQVDTGAVLAVIEEVAADG